MNKLGCFRNVLSGAYAVSKETVKKDPHSRKQTVRINRNQSFMQQLRARFLPIEQVYVFTGLTYVIYLCVI